MTSHQAHAEELLNAMKLLMDDIGAYKSAVALLAVHSAMALNDAVLERLSARVSTRKEHSESHRQTRAACSKNNIDAAGVQHLERLIANKTLYSYQGVVDERRAQDAALRAQRFANWAYASVLTRE